jgi:hypothetical protein
MNANVTFTESQLKAQQLADAATEGRGRAAIVDILTRAEFKPELVDNIYKTILTLVKTTEGLTGKLFRVIQSCDTIHQAKGTFAQAESKACSELKAKSISQVATQGGIKALGSYMAIKSTLFSAVERSEDLQIVLQELWNFEKDHESKEQRYVPEGFLDPWGKRYADKDKGSTLFMADFRQAQKAGDTLKSKQEIHRKAAERAAKEAADKNAAAGVSSQATQGADAGMARSGHVSADVKIDDQTVEALNDLKRAIHDAYGTIEPQVIRQYLYTCASHIRAAVTKAHDATKALATEAASKPIVTEAERSALPEVSSDGILVKPEWCTEEDWTMCASDEERMAILSDKEAYMEQREEDEKNIRELAPQDEAHGPENMTTPVTAVG